MSNKIVKLTKYERARVIGVRATHLENGAMPTIPSNGIDDVVILATKEYEAGRIPLILVRKYPNGISEEIHLFTNNSDCVKKISV
jgi:DNA-directed RNA polymerase I, II, and III subunit RPABC2